MRLTDLTEDMPGQRTPSWNQYCTVISHGPLVIVRMPDEYMRWTVVRKAVFDFMRESYGVKAQDIVAIEGLAGMRPPKFRSKSDAEMWTMWNRKYLEDDKITLPKIEKAFAGDTTLFSAFNLWAWNGKGFTLVRAAKDNPSP